MNRNNSRSSPLYTTPLQFQIIEPRLYRGLYPTEENLDFLKTLELKTIIIVLPEGFDISIETPYYSDFITKNNISLHQFQDENVKRRDKAVGISVEEIVKIIEIVADPNSYPIFIHDLTNESVTPLIVAIFRKLAYWNLVSIIDEFIAYSGNVNVHERKFIEEFPMKQIHIENDLIKESDEINSITSWIRRVGI
ncbi:protein-tyrosine phosphatase [Hanseniaspora valbyensis NRRL Y-1626]|uniref:Protein-tyrosine phosphatase n=1 Tax=Hanseniaspora valbyensis NRRL Y-1626 TaxID=766949 RepID=A0A1B7TIJ1_9ASCO|nr:protein-tyrosine phosphatase [Hanseniaspora valbyensis NRRL Y-1626]